MDTLFYVQNPADQENMGPIQFFPNNGFHSKYYPYLNQEGYRGPVAFIKFMKPKNGVLIQVRLIPKDRQQINFGSHQYKTAFF